VAINAPLSEEVATMFLDPYLSLSTLQQSLDSFLMSNWLGSGMSADGAFRPINVFRKRDDFMVIAEVPGVDSSSIDVQVKNNVIRISGTKGSTMTRTSAFTGANA
jgi:HSP20 family protein